MGFGVRSYPTIKYFNPPDEEGEDYKGGRDLESLRKFASTELGPGCSVDMMENCEDAQKKELETYIAMPAGERDTKLTELKKAMADAEEEHNALLKTLQSTFKESQEKMEKLKEDSAPQIKLLKAATPGPKKDAVKVYRSHAVFAQIFPAGVANSGIGTEDGSRDRDTLLSAFPT